MNTPMPRLPADAVAPDEEEDDGPLAPLDPALEDRLVRGALAKVRADRRRRWGRRADLGTSALVAVGLLLFIMPPELPMMTLDVGEDQHHLGAVAPGPPGPPRLTRDSVLCVTLQAQGHHGSVKVLAFLKSGGTLQRWDVAPQPKGGGSTKMVLRAPVSELPVLGTRPPGLYELIFAVGRWGAGPDVKQVEQALRRNPQGGSLSLGGWQIHHRSIELLGR